MQTGIHYTKDNQRVRVITVDEENKIAYVDYLDGQKKWVNQREYNLLCLESTIENGADSYYIERTIPILVEEGQIFNVDVTKDKKPKKKKDDTANKK